MAFHFAESVDRLILGFVVGSGADFAEQAHGDELDTADEERHGEQHQGAMLRHDGHVVIELFESEKNAESGAAHAQKPKELKRAGGIVQQEFDDHQVEKNANGASDSVVALAVLALEVFDGDFGDLRAGGTGESGNEAMEFAVELDFLDDFAAIGLEGGAEVVQLDAGELGHHPVGDMAGKLPHQPVIAALVAPAADQVVAFFNFFQESRNFFGVVLKIAVHGDDDFAARKIEAGF